MQDVILHGDCLALLKGLPDNSIDALVTDPPAGIAFMGKEWDNPNYFPTRHRPEGYTVENFGHNMTSGPEWSYSGKARRAFITFMTDVMQECLRVVKPGGHAFVWALPRTSHWTASAIEDAGWEIRDVCTHVFGSGFPKSKNLGNGWGSALKPASEHWILARKPLAAGSITQNTQEWGTGGINVDGCRVATGEPGYFRTNAELAHAEGQVYGFKDYAALHKRGGGHQSGRWPPNFLLSHSPACTPAACAEECAVRLLDEQAGNRPGKHDQQPANSGNGWFQRGVGGINDGQGFNDAGGPSRFFPVFYAAKASRRERNEGCEGLPVKAAGVGDNRLSGDFNSRLHPEREHPEVAPAANHHPTVKSLSLMRWLVRLITPPGGLVLDCFAGSGSTLVACVQEGLHYLGMEQDAAYIEIARARLAHAHQEAQQTRPTRKPVSLATRRQKPVNPDVAQMSLFLEVV